MSNPQTDVVTVLPPAARVNWERVNYGPNRSDWDNDRKYFHRCYAVVDGAARGLTTCTRVHGHHGRHAAISQDGTVRKVWE